MWSTSCQVKCIPDPPTARDLAAGSGADKSQFFQDDLTLPVGCGNPGVDSAQIGGTRKFLVDGMPQRSLIKIRAVSGGGKAVDRRGTGWQKNLFSGLRDQDLALNRGGPQAAAGRSVLDQGVCVAVAFDPRKRRFQVGLGCRRAQPQEVREGVAAEAGGRPESAG